MTKNQYTLLCKGTRRFRLTLKNDKCVTYKYKVESVIDTPNVSRVWLYRGPKMWRFLGNIYWVENPTFERHCPEYDTQYLRLIEEWILQYESEETYILFNKEK